MFVVAAVDVAVLTLIVLAVTGCEPHNHVPHGGVARGLR